MTSRDGRSLPLAAAQPGERADAARNRQRILAAASNIVAAKGAGALNLYDVAKAAGVGVGTVYRRFADLPTLIEELIDDRERHLQAAFLSGPPPLGPGAPPADRIRAFLHALVDRVAEHQELFVLAAAQAPLATYNTGAHRVYQIHLGTLLTELWPDCDVEYLADALLAPVAAPLLQQQRKVRGFSGERVHAGVDQLLDRFLP